MVKYDNYKESTVANEDTTQPELLPFRNALLHRLLLGELRSDHIDQGEMATRILFYDSHCVNQKSESVLRRLSHNDISQLINIQLLDPRIYSSARLSLQKCRIIADTLKQGQLYKVLS